ncbi:MAG: YdjY domain-containing protein [Planctomycetaceae bacterium]
MKNPTAANLMALALVCNACGSSVFVFGETQSKSPKDAAAKAPEDLIPLNRSKTVLLDRKGKRVLLKAKVVLREGLLEMLCCPTQTKEHESILAVDAKAYVVHAGLLALGAKPGKPAQFLPEFKPPTGQKIDIFLQWTDEKGKPHRAKAQEWIRHAVRRYYGEKLETMPPDVKIPKDSELYYDDKHKELAWFGHMTAKQRDELTALSQDAAYRKAIKSFFDRSQPRLMQADFVFAGSGFYVDDDGQKYYQAEGGDLICVANFPSAMIDVSIESSASGEQNLAFEPVTERIPPVDTDVTIELVPVFEKPKATGK